MPPDSEHKSDQRDGRERKQVLVSVAIKVVLIAVAIGLAIGGGTWIVVKSLGLNATTASVGPPPVQPITPLPTTALPVPTDVPTGEPSGLITDTPTAGATGGLVLSAAPVFVKSMERINLTGQWPGHDAMSLLVQQRQNGQWVNFGVSTQINVGTFGTWVETGHLGDQFFRVYDPESKTASNPVKVTVQG